MRHLGIISSSINTPPEWLSSSPSNFFYGESVSLALSYSSLDTATLTVAGSLPSSLSYFHDSYGQIVYINGTVTTKSSYYAVFTISNYKGFDQLIISGTPTVQKINATGGTVTDYNGWRIHQFTSSGTFTVSSGADDIEYAVLAGGGGGASDGNGAGGGGAGGYFVGSSAIQGSRNMSIVVGAGGSVSTAGNYSQLFDTTLGISYAYANGGGRGGVNSQTGGSGGSGGGGGCFASGGSGISGLGFNGGSSTWFNGGGGGGIGSAGSNGGTNPNETGGNGGNGLATPPSGWLSSQVVRGGGGGGGGGSQGGSSSGGSGGGGIGRGFTTGGNATQGTEQYGAGGGGGYYNGAKGGSGYVWIRYSL